MEQAYGNIDTHQTLQKPEKDPLRNGTENYCSCSTRNKACKQMKPIVKYITPFKKFHLRDTRYIAVLMVRY